MKYLIPIFCLVFCFCSTTTEQDEASSDDSYTSYDGYSYKGEEPSSDTTFFYCIDTKEGFDSLFYRFPYHLNTAAVIPESEFLAKRVISIVKCGDDYYDMEIESVRILKDTLQVKYKAILQAENMTWTAAIPLIMTVDSAFTRIRFYENSKEINEIILDE